MKLSLLVFALALLATSAFAPQVARKPAFSSLSGTKNDVDWRGAAASFVAGMTLATQIATASTFQGSFTDTLAFSQALFLILLFSFRRSAAAAFHSIIWFRG
jgi:hypothetical protein